MYSLHKRGSSHTHSTLTEEATMMLKVRGIVTGHDEFGMGIVVSDEKLSAVSRGLGANISGCEIWSHKFHASRQLDGSGGRATSWFCQEIQLCRQRPGREFDAHHIMNFRLEDGRLT
jgi:hypothetical protein